jgi:hypothetical protein
VCYAVTNDGVELPVIDVTHPAFAVDVRPEDLPRIEEESIRKVRRTARLPRFIGRIVGLRSPIMRGTLRASGGVLDGMTTYLYKLGPSMLGKGYSIGVDRELNSQMGPVAARLRFHAHVGLTADALEAALAARAGSSVRVLNLGGGTAVDSVAALIVLRQRRPDVLEARSLTIDVLDSDRTGPSFGARALAALQEEDGPLAGLDIRLSRVEYDWTRPWSLRRLLGEGLRAEIVQCVSEGALLEYAPDDVVTANLTVLGELLPDDCSFVATAIRPARILQVWREVSAMPFQARTRDELADLVESGGWRIARSIEGNPVYHVVELRRLAAT